MPSAGGPRQVAKGFRAGAGAATPKRHLKRTPSVCLGVGALRRPDPQSAGCLPEDGLAVLLPLAFGRLRAGYPRLGRLLPSRGARRGAGLRPKGAGESDTTKVTGSVGYADFAESPPVGRHPREHESHTAGPGAQRENAAHVLASHPTILAPRSCAPPQPLTSFAHCPLDLG